MDKIYMKGELLRVITVDEEEYEGRFDDMTDDKSKISLYAVKESPKGKPIEGMCHFYKPEVQKILKLQTADELADHFSQDLKLTQKECETVIKMSNKYIYINQVDNTYHEALEDLKGYGYVAVGTDGAEMGRKCKLPFLTLSTPHQIYIFDIQVMQYHAFEGGLKQLLESEYPKKIIHDCRRISDCLQHKHGVELKSVFDTQVGDIIISKNKTGHLPTRVKSLQDCMRLYLGLPASTIQEKVGTTHFRLSKILSSVLPTANHIEANQQSLLGIWLTTVVFGGISEPTLPLNASELDVVECTKRPLSVAIKETLAKNVAYVHRLSEVINEEMLLPYARGVDCYVNSIRSTDDFQAWELCGRDRTAPKEFANAIEY